MFRAKWTFNIFWLATTALTIGIVSHQVAGSGLVGMAEGLCALLVMHSGPVNPTASYTPPTLWRWYPIPLSNPDLEKSPPTLLSSQKPDVHFHLDDSLMSQHQRSKQELPVIFSGATFYPKSSIPYAYFPPSFTAPSHWPLPSLGFVLEVSMC